MFMFCDLLNALLSAIVNRESAITPTRKARKNLLPLNKPTITQPAAQKPSINSITSINLSTIIYAAAQKPSSTRQPVN